MTVDPMGDPGPPVSPGPDPARRARELWRLFEPVHAVVYFAPDEARQQFGTIGLKGFWMSYFASRAAPLGRVGPDVVQALFYVFHPAMVARALPDAWRLSSPEAVLAVRSALAEATLRRTLGDLASTAEAAIAAELAAAIAQGAPLAGRPLGAAHAALPLPPPTDPLARLWWAATVLREHRFDGHVAALVTAGVDPCSALVLAAASGAVGPEGAAILQSTRKWPDQDWAEATERLAAWGWLDGAGGPTAEGRAAHRSIEDATDRAAAVAYTGVARDDLDTLARALRPLVAHIAGTDAVPYPNPIGLDPRSA
jgi:hypothetical protein